MKAVLLPIRPKWIKLIERGEKTIEVRRSCPMQLTEPFKVFIYCTKGKDRLISVMHDGEMNYGTVYHGKPVFITISEDAASRPKQSVIGEFICSEIQEHYMNQAGIEYLVEHGRMTEMDVLKYAGNRMRLYSWKISDLKWYAHPKTLEDFGLTRAPQSWQYVEVPDDL